MQGSLLRFEAIESRLARSTWHRTSRLVPPRPSGFHTVNTEGRRSEQTTGANGPPSVSGLPKKPRELVRRYVLPPPKPRPKGPVRNGDPTDAAKEVLAEWWKRGRDSVRRALTEVSNDREYIGSIQPQVFRAMITYLKPAMLLGPYLAANQDLSVAKIKMMGIQPIERIKEEFVGSLEHIVAQRRRAGHTMSTVEYTYLLQWARLTRNVRMADSVWRDMAKDGVEPSVKCCNEYMAVKCQSAASPQGAMRELHGIQHVPMRSFAAERRDSITAERRRRLSAEVWHVYQQMESRGLQGNTESFALLMLACARAEDLAGAERILESVWKVDVKKLMQENVVAESSGMSAQVHPPSSPLQPNYALLSALVHAYGMNNNILMALKLVDHFSSVYSMVIPRRIWSDLLDWTYVVSRRRSSTGTTDETSPAAQPPISSVSMLWDTLVSEPYRITPTMPMYNTYIISMNARNMLSPTLDKMRQGKSLYQNAVIAYRVALKRYLAFLDSQRSASFRDSLYGLKDDALVYQRKLESARMIRARDYDYIKRWVRLLLGNSSWRFAGKRADWEYRGLPDAVDEWRPFLPATVQYSIRTGRVEIDVKGDNLSVREMSRRRLHASQTARARPKRRHEKEDQPSQRSWEERRLDLDGDVRPEAPLSRIGAERDAVDLEGTL